MVEKKPGIDGRKSSFTLIELLVVIAIVAILAAMLLPSLKTALEHARRAACTNKLKQIHMASMLYSSDYNEYFISTFSHMWGTSVAGRGNIQNFYNWTWCQDMAPYFGMHIEETTAYNGSWWIREQPQFRCPTQGEYYKHPSTAYDNYYGMNSRATMTDAGNTGGLGSIQDQPPDFYKSDYGLDNWKLIRINKIWCETILFVDTSRV